LLNKSPYLAGDIFDDWSAPRSPAKTMATLGGFWQIRWQKPAFWPKFKKVILISANGQ